MSTLGKCFLTLITWIIPDLFMNSLDMHFKMSSFGEWFLTVNTLMIPYLFMNSLDMLTSDFEAMELHIHTDSFMFELNVLLWMRLPWTLVITLITRIPYPFMNRINMFSQMTFWWCFVLTLTTVKLYSFVNTRCPLWKNDFSQWLHGWSMICSWTPLICTLRYCIWENDFSHILHWWSLISSWTALICIFRLVGNVAWYPHWLQGYLIPSCMDLMCRLRFPLLDPW